MPSAVALAAKKLNVTVKLKLALALLALGAATGGAAADVSSSQYWHERYHGILSMAAYGDYATLCPQQTFTSAALYKSFPNSTEDPWTLLSSFGPTASGLEGFIATIPEMDKTVIVFKGIYGWEYQFNQSSININDIFYLSCDDCQAHAGAVQAYLEAKEATNDWEVVKEAVDELGHQWSITGHGFGGMVAQVASLDLGWRGLAHWSHSHGAPRTLNPASAALFEKLYAGEAGQRTVANNDSVPDTIPESDDYTHVVQGFHIWGTNSTYGMNYAICDDADDTECLGGSTESDHWFYYTQVGSCGGKATYNTTLQRAEEKSLSSEYFATATVDAGALVSNSSATSAANLSSVAELVNSTSTVLSTSTSTSTSASSAVSTASASGVAEAAAASVSATAVAASTSSTSSASRSVVASIAGLALALLGAAVVA